jgi:hypothetical protein
MLSPTQVVTNDHLLGFAQDPRAASAFNFTFRRMLQDTGSRIEGAFPLRGQLVIRDRRTGMRAGMHTRKTRAFGAPRSPIERFPHTEAGWQMQIFDGADELPKEYFNARDPRIVGDRAAELAFNASVAANRKFEHFGADLLSDTSVWTNVASNAITAGGSKRFDDITCDVLSAMSSRFDSFRIRTGGHKPNTIVISDSIMEPFRRNTALRGYVLGGIPAAGGAGPGGIGFGGPPMVSVEDVIAKFSQHLSVPVSNIFIAEAMSDVEPDPDSAADYARIFDNFIWFGKMGPADPLFDAETREMTVNATAIQEIYNPEQDFFEWGLNSDKTKYRADYDLTTAVEVLDDSLGELITGLRTP